MDSLPGHTIERFELHMKKNVPLLMFEGHHGALHAHELKCATLLTRNHTSEAAGRAPQPDALKREINCTLFKLLAEGWGVLWGRTVTSSSLSF
jgi:hypothetical protein